VSGNAGKSTNRLKHFPVFKPRFFHDACVCPSTPWMVRCKVRSLPPVDSLPSCKVTKINEASRLLTGAVMVITVESIYLMDNMYNMFYIHT
jgi:hypothetical protein